MKNLSHLYKSLICLIAISLSLMAQAEAAKTFTAKNNIRFMSGGIGHDETLEMRPFAKQFNLNLLFSEGKIGRSAAGISVSIYNIQDAMVFSLKDAGPLLYVNLPAGSYTISASNNHMKLRHKLSLEDNTPQKVILNWKDKVEEDDLVRE
ncbi:MAG: hypothetical protein EXR38_00455 [Methylotenera sp.]|nr:hypothetical protein [Methylotenera sp.]